MNMVMTLGPLALEFTLSLQSLLYGCHQLDSQTFPILTPSRILTSVW